MKNTPKRISIETEGRKKYLLPLSDTHIGAPTTDIDKVKGMLKWAREHNAWILLLGDIMETSTRHSVGAGVYEQTLNPQQQLDYAVELLEPYKDLIIGSVSGNHEFRTTKESGLDATKNMCDRLGIPFLGYSVFVDMKIGKQRYTAFATHGASGGTTLSGKVSAITKLSNNREADLFLMGHVHDLLVYSDRVLVNDRRNKTVKTKKRYFVLTGAYLNYFDSYGEMKNYPPSKTGSPRVRLDGEKWDIHISI